MDCSNIHLIFHKLFVYRSLDLCLQNNGFNNHELNAIKCYNLQSILNASFIKYQVNLVITIKGLLKKVIQVTN